MMKADDVKAYLDAIQDNRAIDPASIETYANMLASINATVLGASKEKLSWTDEPGDYTRLLKETAR
jgi:Flp pilus assembly protein TadG